MRWIKLAVLVMVSAGLVCDYANPLPPRTVRSG